MTNNDHTQERASLSSQNPTDTPTESHRRFTAGVMPGRSPQRYMMTVRCAVALSLLVAFGGVGCGQKSCPPETCAANELATFDLSCVPTNLTSVALSGACATDDASPANYVFGPNSAYLRFGSPHPGVCHVELTFATGFRYSADVTFVSESGGANACGGTCSSFVAPTQGTFAVNNPSITCVDAGSDAVADVPTDAPSETTADAVADAGADG